MAIIKETPDVIRVVCYTLTAIWAPTKNCPLAGDGDDVELNVLGRQLT